MSDTQRGQTNIKIGANSTVNQINYTEHGDITIFEQGHHKRHRSQGQDVTLAQFEEFLIRLEDYLKNRPEARQILKRCEPMPSDLTGRFKVLTRVAIETDTVLPADIARTAGLICRCLHIPTAWLMTA